MAKLSDRAKIWFGVLGIPIISLNFGTYLLLEFRQSMSLSKFFFWNKISGMNGKKEGHIFVEEEKESFAEDKKEEDKGEERKGK